MEDKPITVEHLRTALGEIGLLALCASLFSPAARRDIAARVQWEEDVCRVCCVYPSRVPVDAMSKALGQTGLDPASVYRVLAEGKTIPALDALLVDVREPW